MRDEARPLITPHHLQKAEALQIGAERNAQIDHPARPLELLRHLVGVDVLVDRLSPAARKPVIVFALLCGALFTGVIGSLGAVYVYELDADETSQELEWPSWMIYLCIPLGSYLMCFRFLQVTWRFLRTGYNPHHGHAAEVESVVPPHAAIPEPAQ